MTEPPDPSPPDGPPVVDPQPIVPWEPGPVPDSARPGLRTFSLEGRRAPGLYLVGWLGTILGAALLIVAALARPGGAGGLVLGVIGTLLLAIGLVAAAGAQGIDRRDRADLAYRGPSPFLVFAASVPLVVVIGLPFALVGLEPDSPIAALASVSVTCAIWLTLVAMTVVGIGALSWRDVFVGWVDTPLVRIAGDLAIGAVAAVPVLLATTILAAVLVSIMGVAPDPPIVIPPGGTGLLIGLLAAAVVAPISEEIFYRGFATTAWARSFGPTGADRARWSVLRGRSRPDDRRVGVRAGRPGGDRRLRRPVAGRLRARLDLRPPSLAAGVDRSSRRLQRDRRPHHGRGPRLIRSAARRLVTPSTNVRSSER